MRSARHIWLCGWANLRKWRGDPRLAVLAVTTLAFAVWNLAQLREYAQLTGQRVAPWVFPFFLANPLMIALFGCWAVLLFCDAPFADAHTAFVIIRVGPVRWGLGQVLYILQAATLYTLFLWLAVLLPLAGRIEYTLSWGNVIETLALYPEAPRQLGIGASALAVTPQVVELYTPLEATGQAVGMVWLVIVFMGGLIFGLNLVFRRRAVGVAAAAGLVFMAYFAYYVGILAFGEAVFYVSPVAWASLNSLDLYGTQNMPTVSFAATALALGAAVFMALGVWVLAKRDVALVWEG